MAKIALFFDRPYIDAHYCFMDLATQLAVSGYDVDLYMVRNAYNNQPFFQVPNIRVFAFPVSKMEKLEFWAQVLGSRDRKYAAIIGTPIKGTWLANRVARLQKIPYYYLADELVKTLL